MKHKLNYIILIIGVVLIVLSLQQLYSKLYSNTLFHNSSKDLWFIFMLCTGIYMVFKVISFKPRKIKKFDLNQDQAKEDS